MQPNDPNQQPTGFPGGQQPQQPQFQQPAQQYGQPQQPYVAPPQPNSFAQQPFPPNQQMGQPQAPLYGAPQQPAPSPYLNPLEPSPQQFQPLPVQPVDSGGGGKKVLFGVVALVVVVVLGVGGYLIATQSKKKTPTTSSHTSSTTSNMPMATGDLTKLASFTLAAPTGTALGGMTLTAASSASTYAKLSNADGSCTIGFAVLSQTAEPGTDLNSLIANKIADAKQQDANIKVTGPNTATSLMIKDAAGKTYALPTATFSLTDTATGGGTIFESFSAVELSDKSHAVIYNFCSSDKANDQTAMAAKVQSVQPVEQAILVQTK